MKTTEYDNRLKPKTMTDKEKILAEIERLKKEAFNKINHNGKRDMVTDVANSQRIAICEQLLDFINSLPAGQPSDDLEKEIDRYFKDDKWFSTPLGDIARYFANWQKEQLMKNVVETKVQGRIDGKGIFIDTDIPIGIDVNEDDKVKIIIIKENEQ